MYFSKCAGGSIEYIPHMGLLEMGFVPCPGAFSHAGGKNDVSYASITTILVSEDMAFSTFGLIWKSRPLCIVIRNLCPYHLIISGYISMWGLIIHKEPVMWSLDIFFVVSLNKLLTKQSICW